MPKAVTKLPVTILRGGTSKGVYILESDLPSDKGEWDSLLLRLMGNVAINVLLSALGLFSLGGLFY